MHAPTKPRRKPPTEITLPLPPSVNHYWRVVRGRPIISRDGRAYREQVQRECRIQGIFVPFKEGAIHEGRLQVSIRFNPPDKRRRDLDNILKSSLDSLAHARVYEDDSQIDVLNVARGEIVKGGSIAVTITELSGTEVG